MNRSVIMAVMVALLMTAWMASGMQDDKPSVQASEPSAQTKPLMKVKIIDSSARKVQQFVRIQGQVEANRTIELRAEIDGRVEALSADEGQRLQAGDPLLQISADFRAAQLAEAQALLKQRKSDLTASINLKNKGLQSENKVFADQAGVEAAQAQLARIEHELRETQVTAPFTGVLNQRMVKLGDYLQAGDVLGQLVDDETVKVTGQVPQHSVGRLEESQPVDVTLSNGSTLTGRLNFIAPVADPVTRSYRVEVQIPNPQHSRIIGLSATLKLPAGEQSGHLLPGSVLGLNEAGNLQVRLVDAQNRVSETVVEIIRTDSNGFWLSGLNDEARVITIGQDFVAVGEEVEPVSDTGLMSKQVSNLSLQEN
ncbi:efflux RND transporter periplasmic adaptor subunit [Amphritea pacifica]|uniref:efflux RND transporter periplasmic adaptor subunit n=1 Tax=Amphritea pacifica TaxID=2811233 RepID=UPI001965DE22|nr:efflux RND transporter periplasmic adaptor subunit [Amphritea pacifica]MBN1008801.1 efflux RND transporter periplasmic adaptor subunit [Amphritea pacifica]